MASLADVLATIGLNKNAVKEFGDSVTNAVKEVQGRVKSVKATIHVALEGIEKANKQLEDLRGTILGITAAAGVSSFAAIHEAAAEATNLARANQFLKQTQEELNTTMGQAREVANDIGISFKDASSSLLAIAKAGLTGKDAIDALRAAAQLASPAGISTGEAFSGMNAVVKTFGGTATEAADKIFALASAAKVAVPQAAEAFQRLGPIAKSFNIDIDQVGAAFATITGTGVSAGKATKELIDLFRGLGSSSPKVVGALKDAGIVTGENAFQTQTLTEKLKLLDIAVKSDSVEIKELFGKFNSSQAFKQLTADAGKMSENLLTMANSTGTAKAAFEEFDKTAAAQLENLGVLLGNLVGAVGSKLLDSISGYLGTINKFLKENQEAAASFLYFLVGLASAVGALGTAATILGGIVSAVLALVSFIPAIIAGTKAVLAFAAGVVSLLNPVTALAAALVTVEIALAAVTSAFAAVSIGAAIAGIVGGIRKFINESENAQAVITAFKASAITAFEGVKDGIAALTQPIRDFIDTLSNKVFNSLEKNSDGFISTFTNLGQKAANLFRSIGENIGSVFSDIFKIIGPIVIEAVDTAIVAFNQIPQALSEVKDGLSKIWAAVAIIFDLDVFKQPTLSLKEFQAVFIGAFKLIDEAITSTAVIRGFGLIRLAVLTAVSAVTDLEFGFSVLSATIQDLVGRAAKGLATLLLPLGLVSKTVSNAIDEMNAYGNAAIKNAAKNGNAAAKDFVAQQQKIAKEMKAAITDITDPAATQKRIQQEREIADAATKAAQAQAAAQKKAAEDARAAAEEDEAEEKSAQDAAKKTVEVQEQTKSVAEQTVEAQQKLNAALETTDKAKLKALGLSDDDLKVAEKMRDALFKQQEARAKEQNDLEEIVRLTKLKAQAEIDALPKSDIFKRVALERQAQLDIQKIREEFAKKQREAVEKTDKLAIAAEEKLAKARTESDTPLNDAITHLREQQQIELEAADKRKASLEEIANIKRKYLAEEKLLIQEVINKEEDGLKKLKLLADAGETALDKFLKKGKDDELNKAGKGNTVNYQNAAREQHDRIKDVVQRPEEAKAFTDQAKKNIDAAADAAKLDAKSAREQADAAKENAKQVHRSRSSKEQKHAADEAANKADQLATAKEQEAAEIARKAAEDKKKLEEDVTKHVKDLKDEEVKKAQDLDAARQRNLEAEEANRKADPRTPGSSGATAPVSPFDEDPNAVAPKEGDIPAEAEKAAETVDTPAQQLTSTLNQIQTVFQQIQTAFQPLTAAADNVQAAIASIQDFSNAAAQLVDSEATLIENISGFTDAVTDKMTDMVGSINNLSNRVAENTARIQALETKGVGATDTDDGAAANGVE